MTAKKKQPGQSLKKSGPNRTVARRVDPTGPRRAVITAAPRGRGYPEAADLLSSVPAWQGWLEHALRQVLGPAALASAVGLAGAGCDDAQRVAHDLWDGPPGITAGAAPVSGAGGQAGAKPPPGTVGWPSSGASGGHGGGPSGGPVTLTPLGAPTMPPSGSPPIAAPTGPVAPLGPPIQNPMVPLPRPPVVPGPVIVPDPHPPALAGDVAIVQPVPAVPAPNPPTVRGQLPAPQPTPIVRPMPADRPPRTPGRRPIVRPRPPIDPPDVAGGLRAVDIDP